MDQKRWQGSTPKLPQTIHHLHVVRFYDEEGRTVTPTAELLEADWVIIGSTGACWTYVKVETDVYLRVYAETVEL